MKADVTAAQAGDAAALDRLVVASLPLVYNVVGRALNGHDDADDVVQETMARVLGGLRGLHDPSSYRSWLVAVAMNEVRRWNRQRPLLIPMEVGDRFADPAADFTGLSILRLGLIEAHRELARAAQWLDGDDFDLLTLWRLEKEGELTRSEVARVLDISPVHAGVRIQRLKARLASSREVVRALAAVPGCVGLAAATAEWDGVPAPLWRNRISRHIRDCADCSGRQQDLIPIEVLLPHPGLLLHRT